MSDSNESASMISIRDALMASGHSAEAEELSRLDKFELIDSDGTSLGWKTWEEIVSGYSLDVRVSNHKTSSLPWNATKPQEGTRTVRLCNITARDIAHLSPSRGPADALSLKAPEPVIATRKKPIPKRWVAFEPLDATYSLYDSNGRYVGERSMLEILNTYDLKWTFYLDGVRAGRPPKDKKAPPMDEVTRKKLIEDIRRRKSEPNNKNASTPEKVAQKTPAVKDRFRKSKLGVIEYVAPTPPRKRKSSKEGPEERVGAQSTTKSVSSQEGVHETGVENVSLARRHPSLLESCLSPYSDDVQDYIREMLLRPDVGAIVSREVSRHPERYAAIKRYQNVLRRVTALANIYLHRNEDELENLMDLAHLFVFDDDAWWAARNCTEPLTKLPYPICIVEDVAFYDEEGTIRARALSNRADVDGARRLLSFVANSCGKVEADGSSDFVAVGPDEETKGESDLHNISSRKRSRSGSSTSRISLAGTHASGARANGHHESPAVHYRRGHWRNQACGHGLKQHKRIWISETIVAPSGVPFKIGNPKRVHRVSYHNSERQPMEPRAHG